MNLFFFLRRALYGLYTVQSSCMLDTKMDSVDRSSQRRRERERSHRASKTGGKAYKMKNKPERWLLQAMKLATEARLQRMIV